MNKQIIISEFEKEVENELREERENAIIGKELDDANDAYNKFIEPKVNEFLSENGIDARFLASDHKDIESWVVDNFDCGREPFAQIVVFVESLPTFGEFCESRDITISHNHHEADAYKVFLDFWMDSSYERDDFSSEVAWKRYQECCHSAVVDYD